MVSNALETGKPPSTLRQAGSVEVDGCAAAVDDDDCDEVSFFLPRGAGFFPSTSNPATGSYASSLDLDAGFLGVAGRFAGVFLVAFSFSSSLSLLSLPLAEELLPLDDELNNETWALWRHATTLGSAQDERPIANDFCNCVNKVIVINYRTIGVFLNRCFGINKQLIVASSEVTLNMFFSL
jgi:hypothetical protein